MLGAGNEIGEGIALEHHPALVAPDLAHLPAAANMGDDVNHAPVQQGEPGIGKGHRAWNGRRNHTRTGAAGCVRPGCTSFLYTTEHGIFVPSEAVAKMRSET